MPQRTDEEWRRTDLRALKLDRFAPFTGVGETVVVARRRPGRGFDRRCRARAACVVQRDASTIYAEINPDAVADGVIFTRSDDGG